MPTLTLIYWRDIPAQVTAKAGRTAVKRELPARFAEAIDMAAMRSGAKSADDYLEDWRRADPETCGDDLAAEVDSRIALIDQSYDALRLRALIDNGGRES